MNIKELENLYHELDKAISVNEANHAKDIQYLESARKHQALEYERRLKILNNEARQLKDMQATYLPREQWEETIRGLVANKDQLIGSKDVISVLIAAAVAGLVAWLGG